MGIKQRAFTLASKKGCEINNISQDYLGNWSCYIDKTHGWIVQDTMHVSCAASNASSKKEMWEWVIETLNTEDMGDHCSCEECAEDEVLGYFKGVVE